MPNPEIAQLIGESLGSGLPHPGNPANREGPRLLDLVAFRTAGLPAEMVQHVRNTAQATGEAIVNLIETKGQTALVPRAELDELRAADDQPGDSLPVMCTACKEPMLFLRVVNGRALVTPDLLRGINLSCPHNMEATP